MDALEIRPAQDADAEAIAEIYAPYIRDTIITFEVERVPADAFVQRMRAVREHRLPWLVAERAGVVVGYAYATPWRARAAYAAAAEATVYLAQDAVGQGIGRTLYEDLFERLRALGKHVVIGGISLPNSASVALHERMGMHKVAHFEAVGRKFDRWIDVGYWQRTL